MRKKVVRFTHDPGWGHRVDDVLRDIAEVVTLKAKSSEEVVRAARGAEVILVTSLGQRGLFDADTIARLDGVKVLYLTGVGWDPIDPSACTRKGIVLANNPDFCTYEVAEHTLGLILSLFRKIPFAHASVKERGHAEWTEFAPMYRVFGKTAGVVGFGRTGRRVSRLLVGLGMEVLVHDHHAEAKRKAIEEIPAAAAGLEELLRSSDVVTLHVPLSAKTRHMIGERELRMMKRSAVLVNTARGDVIDETALVSALREGVIRGAALDVFAKEPLPKDSPVTALDNVVLTPHLASTSEESVSLADLAQEVKRVLSGARPANVVNGEALGG
ncbi:MAG: C-terminal binding protein [Planctomycetota bacterium]